MQIAREKRIHMKISQAKAGTKYIFSIEIQEGIKALIEKYALNTYKH